MSLTSGTRLGSYEIVAPLGAGGMGEVYRARDRKLNREVAIKVLPPSFALDADRAARFTREAQLLASLNHPNIAQIYGVEESSGEGPSEGVLRALVMELVAGEDLSTLIARHGRGSGRSPAGMPLAEVLPIARQIADALDAAHEQGIVHRDLKPQNIKVRDDGTVKVLDFGLAKAMLPAAASNAAVSDSPTMTVDWAQVVGAAETQVGMIMGTAPYMAPEQAKGKPVDKRADIWAFGVVLYEMLTGSRAFVGESVTDILARVIERDPDWDALPPSTPPHIRRLLERCLAKDPRARLRDIGEARVMIDDKSTTVAFPAAVSAPVVPPPPRPSRLPWGVAIVASVAALGMAALWLSRSQAPAVAPGLTVEAALGADGVIDTAGVADVISPLALSRDGQQLAFVALDAGGQTSLFVRGLQQLDAKMLPGTDGASSPFFAPDGQSIGFFAHGKLKKATLAGIVTSLADAPHGRGGSFTDDGRIIYSPNNPSGNTLMSMPVDGGAATKLLSLMPGEATQRWPQVLPGGKSVLYTSHRSVAGFDRARIVVAPLDGGAPKVVLAGAYDAQYLPSGHLLFARQGTLFAVAFDLATLTVHGEPVPLAQHVSANTIHGSASYAVSPTGVLAYVSGPVISKTRPIYWMNSTGATTVLRETPLDWDSPRVSPDGRLIAMTVDEGERENVFVYDPARDLLTRVASADMNSQGAVWAPDGKHVAFAADVDGARNLFWAHADGSGGIERLTRSPHIQVPTSFDPTGRQLAYFEVNADTNMDAMLLPIEGSDAQGWKGGTPVPIANTPAREGPAAISPDGKWIAYTSDTSGRPEVYVQRFPPGGPHTQVSAEGGQYPLWSRTRPELFFEGPGNVIMVAPYRADGGSLVPGKPGQWSPVRFWNPGARWAYDLHPDGLRFVVSKVPTSDGARGDRVVLSTDLFGQLQRLVPAKR